LIAIKISASKISVQKFGASRHQIKKFTHKWFTI